MKKQKETLLLKIKLRRWKKSYVERTKFHGWLQPLLEDFFPFYNRLSRLYWWVKHRTISVYHKVNTGLAPGYYDIDSLMLYSCFSLLERYVDGEYKGVKDLESRIADLKKWTQEDIKDIPEEHHAHHIENNNRQIADLKEAIALYEWWKSIYPKYDDNDPLNKKSVLLPNKKIDFVPCKFDKDGDPYLFELKSNLTKEEKEIENRIYQESSEYNQKVEAEIENNLIRLIKLRRSLWT